jgi:hypothetical protein
MQQWHIHAVRVPLNEDCWLGINGVNPQYGGARYVAAIRNEVGLINAHGMIAVLDLHWSAPGAWAAIAQQPLPDRDHSPAFWGSVAATFLATPGVIFDIFNEPYVYDSFLADAGISPWGCWRNGCDLNQLISAYQLDHNGAKTAFATPYRWSTAGMQELIAAIRNVGAEQPIMASGLDWSNDLSGWLAHAPDDPLHQLIAGWHSYRGERCSDPACWQRTVAKVARSVPVVVGETGDAVCTPSDYLGDFLPWADAHGLSYLGWAWDTWQDCRDVLISSWTGSPTSNYGEVFLDHLRRLG